MKKVVFDIETKNFFHDVGSNDPAALDISIVCVYDYESDSYSSYLENELPRLWPLLERTDILIGYNSDHFDIPLLNKYYSGDLGHIKSLDILSEIKKFIGRRVSLNSVAEATLGKKKSGDGMEAVRWWKKGDIESLRKYCVDDVKLTKEIYDYAIAHKSLKYKDRDTGRIVSLDLDTSKWEKKEDSAMTFSLPF